MLLQLKDLDIDSGYNFESIFHEASNITSGETLNSKY